MPVFVASAALPRAPREPFAASSSEFVLRAEPWTSGARRSASELLTLAPGVFLLNHSGLYHANTMLLRGFDAGEGQDLEVLVDGAPINEISNAHGHGYADTSFLIPELISDVRVIEGPFAPAQSDFAVAGSAEYRLGPSTRGIRLGGDVGSFDTRRAVAIWAPVGAQHGTFVGIDLRDTAGFGINRAASSLALNAGYEHAVSNDLRVAFSAFGHLANFASPGVVREDDVDAKRLACGAVEPRFCTYDSGQGGDGSRVLGTARIAWMQPLSRFDQLVFGGWRNLRMRENWTGTLLDPRGDRIDQGYRVATVGLRGRYRTNILIEDQLQAFEIGWLARHDSGRTRALRTRSSDAVPYSALFDDELQVTHLGGHLATDMRFASWFEARASIRVDGFSYSTLEHDEPTSDRMGERLPLRANDAFGLSVGPRGTLRVRPLPWLLWQTSMGIGTRSSDATALSDGEFAPYAEVLASETGLVAQVRQAHEWLFEARASAFHTHVDRDLVFDVSRGRNVLTGASSRLGAQAFVRFRLDHWVTAIGSFAYSEAYLLPLGASLAEFVSDARMPYVPRFVGRLDIAFERSVQVGSESIAFGATLGAGLLGERPLPLGRVADPVLLVDGSVHARWRIVQLGLAVQNLTDARWRSSTFHYASNFGSSDTPSMRPEIHYATGAPLTVLFTFALRIDESAPLDGPSAPIEVDESTEG